MKTEVNNETLFHDSILAALDLLSRATDALMETAALKQIVKACETRLEKIKDEAICLAEEELTQLDLSSGRFKHEDLLFELSLTNVYDFAGKPTRYTMEAGVQYRAYAKEQAELKKQAEAKTKLMNALMKNFAASNPAWKPDTVKKVLKCLEA